MLCSVFCVLSSLFPMNSFHLGVPVGPKPIRCACPRSAIHFVLRERSAFFSQMKSLSLSVWKTWKGQCPSQCAPRLERSILLMGLRRRRSGFKCRVSAGGRRSKSPERTVEPAEESIALSQRLFRISGDVCRDCQTFKVIRELVCKEMRVGRDSNARLRHRTARQLPGDKHDHSVAQALKTQVLHFAFDHIDVHQWHQST